MVWITLLLLFGAGIFWLRKFQAQFDQLLAILHRLEDKVDRLAAPPSRSTPPVTETSAPAALVIPEPSVTLPDPPSKERLDRIIIPDSLLDSTPDPLPTLAPGESKSRLEPDPIPDFTHVTPTETFATQAPRPQWAEDASVLVKRMVSWVLVGEEHRPKGMSLEFAVASTWLMRLGIIVLVACVGWFLKWSMDHGILGPSGRVGLSFLAGTAFLIAGYRQMGKRYQVLGQGLLGGGLAALYFACFAAGPLYDLIPILACFAVMALVTVTGCALAVITQSQVIAVLAMLGGYCTPIVLSTGHPNFLGLYSYMTLLGSGILAMAIARNWRVLHYLAFLAHWGLVLGSLKDYEASRHFATVLPFLILFFLQQHGVILGYALRRAQPISLLEALHQLGHTALFTALAYSLIQNTAGRPWTAVLAMGMSALFIAQTALLLKRMPFDRLSLSVSLALAGFFLAWSIPLLLSGSTLVVAWSLMSLAWLWIGLRMESKLLILGSQILLALAAIRLTAFDLPMAYAWRHAGSADFPSTQEPGYWLAFAQRLFHFGVFVGCLFTASWLYRRRETAAPLSPRSDLKLSPEADLPIPFSLGLAGQIVFYVGLFFAFILANNEGGRLLNLYPPISSPGMLLVWLGFAVYLIKRLAKTGVSVLPWVAGAAVGLILLRMVFHDWRYYGCAPWSLRFDEFGLSFLFRTLAHGSVITFLALLAQGRFGLAPTAKMARGYFLIALVLTFLLLTIETQTATGLYLPGFKAGAVSVLWVVFAMALVAFGLKQKDRAMRLAGLGLFAVVAGKVFLLDLSRLEMIWRVLSFMAVGGVLLLGSFAYLRASRPEEEPATAEKEGGSEPVSSGEAKEDK